MDPRENDFHFLVTNFDTLGPYIRVYGQVEFKKSFEMSMKMTEAIKEERGKRIESEIKDDLRNNRVLGICHKNNEIYRFRANDSEPSDLKNIHGTLIDYMVPYTADISSLYQIGELTNEPPLATDYILRNVVAISDELLKVLSIRYQHQIMVGNAEKLPFCGSTGLLELFSPNHGFINHEVVKNNLAKFCDTEVQIQELNCLFYSMQLSKIIKPAVKRVECGAQKSVDETDSTDNYKKEHWNENEVYYVKIVNAINGPGSFIVQKAVAITILKDFHVFIDSQVLTPYRKGTRKCLLEDSGSYYRGYIVEFYQYSNANVFCVDTCAYFKRKLADLYELPKKASEFAAQAVEFRLFGLDDNLRTKSVCIKFHQILQSRLINLTVRKKHVNDIWEADVTHSGRPIIDILKKFAESGTALPFYRSMQLLPVNHTASIYVCHVENMGKFYVQYNQCVNDIEAIAEATSELSQTSYAIETYEASQNLTCLAYFKKDKLWYRGLVTHNNNLGEVRVFFVDYGNTEMMKLMYLKHITETYVSKWPSMAIECCLDGYQNWMENTKDDTVLLEAFKNLVIEKSFDIKVLRHLSHSNGLVVEMKTEDGKNVMDLLRQECNSLQIGIVKAVEVVSPETQKQSSFSMKVKKPTVSTVQPQANDDIWGDDNVELQTPPSEKSFSNYTKPTDNGWGDDSNNNNNKPPFQKHQSNYSGKSLGGNFERGFSHCDRDIKPQYQKSVRNTHPRFNNDNGSQRKFDNDNNRAFNKPNYNRDNFQKSKEACGNWEDDNSSSKPVSNYNKGGYRNNDAGDNWDKSSNAKPANNFNKSGGGYDKGNYSKPGKDGDNWDDNASSGGGRANQTGDNKWGDNKPQRTNNFNKSGYKNNEAGDNWDDNSNAKPANNFNKSGGGYDKGNYSKPSKDDDNWDDNANSGDKWNDNKPQRSNNFNKGGYKNNDVGDNWDESSNAKPANNFNKRGSGYDKGNYSKPGKDGDNWDDNGNSGDKWNDNKPQRSNNFNKGGYNKMSTNNENGDDWGDDNNSNNSKPYSKNYSKRTTSNNDDGADSWNDADKPYKNNKGGYKSNFSKPTESDNASDNWGDNNSNDSKPRNTYNQGGGDYKKTNYLKPATNKDDGDNWGDDNSNSTSPKFKSYNKSNGYSQPPTTNGGDSWDDDANKSNQSTRRFNKSDNGGFKKKFNNNGDDRPRFNKRNSYSEDGYSSETSNQTKYRTTPGYSKNWGQPEDDVSISPKLTPKIYHYEKVGFEERFPEKQWPANSMIRIRISKFQSLAKFTCRLCDNEAFELNSILKRTYRNQDNMLSDLVKFTINDISKGSSLIVLFHEDYHRAYVVDIFEERKLSVHLVDAGYPIETSLDFCYPVISRDILSIPVQVIHSSLHNRFHLIERPVLHDMIIGRFLWCKIHDFTDGQYIVELYDCNQSLFVNHLLEKNCVYILEKEQNIYHPVYIIGRFFKTYISYIEKFENFYVQFDKNQADQIVSKIHQIVKSKQLTVVENYATDKRAIVLDPETNEYRRVRMIDFSDLSAIKVILSDFGRTVLVPSTDLFEYPDLEILRYDLQAVKCSFKAETDKLMTLEQFKAMENHFYIALVENASENEINVMFFEVSGDPIAIEVPSEDEDFNMPEILPYPVLKSYEMEAYVTTIVDFNNIYVQPEVINDQVLNLLDDLNDFYGKKRFGTQIEDVYSDMMCACKSKADDKWYRAKIQSVTDDNKINVFYIDYGNCELVNDIVSVCVLDKKFFEFHAMAIKVQLNNVNERLFSYVKDQIIDKKLNVTISPDYSIEIKIDRKSLMDLVIVESQDIKVEESLKFTEAKNNNMKIRSQPSYQQSLNLPPIKAQSSNLPKPQNDDADEWGEEKDVTLPVVTKNEEKIVVPKNMSSNQVLSKNMVLISHVDSVTDFYTQVELDADDLFDFSTRINAEVLKGAKDLTEFEIGMKCFAKFSQDEMWYRAEVLDFDDEIVTVRFYDYGNSEVLHIKDNHIKLLENEQLNAEILIVREPYAQRCSLNCTVINDPEAATTRFSELTTVDLLIAEEISYDSANKKKIIELKFKDGTNVTQKLIEENLVKEMKTLSLVRKNGFVSHFNSLDDFWIQFDTSVDDLEATATALTNVTDFPVAESVICGDKKLYAGQFADDELWYRVQVLNKSTNGQFEVQFIDYGNTGVTSEIRELPKGLANLGLLAKQCALRKPAGLTAWSKKANKQFEMLSASGATEFIVKFDESVEPNVVDLYVNDLDSDSDSDSDIEINVINKLDLENSTLMTSTARELKGMITCFVTQSEFQFQPIDIKDNLEVLETKLKGTSNDPLPEIVDFEHKLFTVYHPEKGIYCRAEILSRDCDKFKVLLVDYGDQIEVTTVYKLSDELSIIPKLAIRCCTHDSRITDNIDFNQMLKIKVLSQNDGICQIELIDDPIYVEEHVDVMENISKVDPDENAELTEDIVETPDDVVEQHPEDVINNESQDVANVLECLVNESVQLTTSPETRNKQVSEEIVELEVQSLPIAADFQEMCQIVQTKNLSKEVSEDIEIQSSPINDQFQEKCQNVELKVPDSLDVKQTPIADMSDESTESFEISYQLINGGSTISDSMSEPGAFKNKYSESELMPEMDKNINEIVDKFSVSMTLNNGDQTDVSVDELDSGKIADCSQSSTPPLTSRTLENVSRHSTTTSSLVDKLYNSFLEMESNE